MTRTLLLLLASAAAALVLGGAGREPAAMGDKQPSGSVPTGKAVESQSAPATLRPVGPDADLQPTNAEAAPLYNLNWYSVNGGGATGVTGTNFRLGLSAGQSAAGFANGANYDLGVGFWYGVGGAACPIALSGDIDLSTTITSADIIGLVNYVFKGGATPLPCGAAGDVDCSGGVTSADIIRLVNYVFKGGSPPCDICTVIPSLWSCP